MEVPQDKYPLVTCITTTYRKFNYLFETLDSIFMQNYPNIEIIIGDDGSDNFPEEEIKTYINEHKTSSITNIVILHEEDNRGTVWNCDNCRRHAHGSILMGIASDDRFYDEKVVSDVVCFFNEKHADIITCKRIIVEAATGKEISTMPTKRYKKCLENMGPQKLFEECGSFNFISGANTYYTKTFYEEMKGFDLRYKYIEDVPFIAKTLRNNKKIYFFDRVTIKYRYGKGLSTTSNSNNVFRDAMYADRKKYIENEFIPYMQKWPWWRKEHMKVRMKRFELDQQLQKSNQFKIYLKLFVYSPVGTLVHLLYQLEYRNSVQPFIKGGRN